MKKNILKYLIVLVLFNIFSFDISAVTVSVMPFRVFDDDARTNYRAVDGFARLFSYELFNTRRIHVTDYDLFVAYARDVDNFYNHDILSSNRTLAVNYATNFFKTDYLVFGDVLEISLTTNSQDNIDKAYVSIAIEVMDTSTMTMVTNILVASNFSMPSNRYSQIYKMDDAYFNESILGKTAISVSLVASEAIVAALDFPSIFGAVTKVEEEKTVYVNLGKNNTVLQGDIFEIYDIKRVYQEYSTNAPPPNIGMTNNTTTTNENTETLPPEDNTDILNDDSASETMDNEKAILEEKDKTTDTLENADEVKKEDDTKLESTKQESTVTPPPNLTSKRVARTITGEIIGEIKEKQPVIKPQNETNDTKENLEINSTNNTEIIDNNTQENTITEIDSTKQEDIDTPEDTILNNNENETAENSIENNENNAETSEEDIKTNNNIDLSVIRSNNKKDSIKKKNYVNRLNSPETDETKDDTKQSNFIIVKDKTGKIKYFEKVTIMPEIPRIIKTLLPGDFLSYYRPMYTNDNNEMFYLSEMLFKYKLVKEETNFIGYAKVIDLYESFAVLEIIELADDNEDTTAIENIDTIQELSEIKKEAETEKETKFSSDGFKTKSGKVNYKNYQLFVKEEKEKIEIAKAELEKENSIKPAEEKQESAIIESEDTSDTNTTQTSIIDIESENSKDTNAAITKKREVDTLMRVILIGDK